MVLRIKRKHLDEIFQHARRCYPAEACGILVGKREGEEKIVEKVYLTRNVLASTSEYRIDPIEQLKVFEEAEHQSLNIIGFYHSHPFWEPFWSKTDEDRSELWTGYSFLIVSLKTGKARAYIRRENRAEREEMAAI
jgi:proteasome lid subunit RPN8/RPN11